MSPSTAGLRLYKFATFLIRHLYDQMNRDNALTAVFHSEVMQVLFLAMSDAIRGSLSFQRMVFTCMNGFPHGHPQAGCVAALQQHVPCLWYG